MANGADRIFRLMQQTSEETNPTTSKTISLTVKTTQPLVFTRDDKLDITEDFCIFDNLINKSDLVIGDIVTAFVFANGQQYYIKPSNNNYLENLIKSIILEDNKKKYHVGKIIIDTSNTNPATYLGFGTWQYWGSGRVPVGVNTNDTDFTTVEKTGGEKTHKLTSDELPKISGRFVPEVVNNYQNYMQGVFSAAGQVATGNKSSASVASGPLYGVSINFGNDEAHNNLQPYITCYMWKRIS